MNGSVSQKWLLGILVSIVLMGSAGWMTYVQGQVTTLQVHQAARGADIEVIREKVKRLEEDVRDANKKLDELLRRIR